jgi:hypothetical protein
MGRFTFHIEAAPSLGSMGFGSTAEVGVLLAATTSDATFWRAFRLDFLFTGVGDAAGVWLAGCCDEEAANSDCVAVEASGAGAAAGGDGTTIVIGEETDALTDAVIGNGGAEYPGAPTVGEGVAPFEPCGGVGVSGEGVAGEEEAGAPVSGAAELGLGEFVCAPVGVVLDWKGVVGAVTPILPSGGAALTSEEETPGCAGAGKVSPCSN